MDYLNKYLNKLIRDWVDGLNAVAKAAVHLLGGMTPADRAAILAELEKRARRQPCHCLCGFVHPAAEGICDGDAVTAIRRTPPWGVVDVPTCAPCAAEVMAATAGDAHGDS